jgi:hypothetical protein
MSRTELDLCKLRPPGPVPTLLQKNMITKSNNLGWIMKRDKCLNQNCKSTDE